MRMRVIALSATAAAVALLAAVAAPTTANAGASPSGLFEATVFVCESADSDSYKVRVENYSKEKTKFTIELMHEQFSHVYVKPGDAKVVHLEPFAHKGLVVHVNSDSHHEYVDTPDVGEWPRLPCA